MYSAGSSIIGSYAYLVFFFATTYKGSLGHSSFAISSRIVTGDPRPIIQEKGEDPSMIVATSQATNFWSAYR